MQSSEQFRLCIIYGKLLLFFFKPTGMDIIAEVFSENLPEKVTESIQFIKEKIGHPLQGAGGHHPQQNYLFGPKHFIVESPLGTYSLRNFLRVCNDHDDPDLRESIMMGMNFLQSIIDWYNPYFLKVNGNDRHLY